MSVELAPTELRHSMKSLILDHSKRAGPFTWALVIALGSMLAYFLFLGPPLWGTNDDVSMSMIAAGVWKSAQPSAELLFIHPGYGWLVSQLYTWQPDVPWYGICFIAVVAFSLVMLDYSILRLRRQLPFSLLVLCATIATALPALWHLQFTLIAALATLAGEMLLLSLLAHEPTTRRSFVVAVLASLGLVLLGTMLRFMSALMVSALVAPCAATMLWTSVRTMHDGGKSRRRHIATIVTVGAVVCASVIGLQVLERTHYRASPGWTKWFSLNSAKAEFIDYARIEYCEQTRDIFDSVGWSRNDHGMIMSWQYVDPIRYPPEKLAHVAGAVEARDSTTPGRPNGPGRWGSGLWQMAIHFVLLLDTARAVMVGILIAVLLATRWTKRNVLYVGSAVCATIAILLYLHCGLGRTPLRVLLALWISVLWMTMLIAAGSNRGQTTHQTQRKGWKAVAVAILVLAMLGAMVRDCVDVRGRVVYYTERQKSLEQVLGSWSAHLPPESIIYCSGIGFPYKHHLPLKSFAYLRSIDGFITTGWNNQSPHQRQLITALGLEDDFYASLARKEHVYLAKTPVVERQAQQRQDMAILHNHYKEVHGLELSYVEEPDLPNLYRMVFKEAEKP